MAPQPTRLISYIAPAAPATRRPAEDPLPTLRPEIGFTPKWYHRRLGIDFGQRWHVDTGYRKETVLAMRAELRRCFPSTQIGRIDRPDSPLDLLTGVFGASTVAAIYGVPILYAEDTWPACEQRFVTDDELDRIEPPDLDRNPFFLGLMAQVEEIAEREGSIEGFINWQGVLNNAFRLRGEQLFLDMAERPDRARRLFDAVGTTMIEAAHRLYSRQQASGVEVGFLTVSNCLVNMVSPALYADLLLPCDQRIATDFGATGIHNCAWTADPYLEHYAKVPHVGYIDMGIDSDLPRARELFPNARRAIMYTPMDVAEKTMTAIRADLERVVRAYAPCDLVVADIEDGTPDQRIRDVLALCAELRQE